MRESIWGYAIIVFGILAIGIIWFFANTTRTDQHNYTLLRETVEAAMYDAIDLSKYRTDGSIFMEEEKFVESFVRRFAESADLSNYYDVEIYDISEEPPKVSLKVSSAQEANLSISPYAEDPIIEYKISNNLDAILETKYGQKNTDDEYRCWLTKTVDEPLDYEKVFSPGTEVICEVNYNQRKSSDTEQERIHFKFNVMWMSGGTIKLLLQNNLDLSKIDGIKEINNSKEYNKSTNTISQTQLKSSIEKINDLGWDSEIETQLPAFDDVKLAVGSTGIDFTFNTNTFDNMVVSLEKEERKNEWLYNNLPNTAYWLNTFTEEDGWCVYGDINGNGVYETHEIKFNNHHASTSEGTLNVVSPYVTGSYSFNVSSTKYGFYNLGGNQMINYGNGDPKKAVDTVIRINEGSLIANSEIWGDYPDCGIRPTITVSISDVSLCGAQNCSQ